MPNKESKSVRSTEKVIALLLTSAILVSLALIGVNVNSNTNSIQLLEDSVGSLKSSVERVEFAEDFLVDSKVNKDGYQAVFFIESAEERGGQGGLVYFGKLSDGELAGQVELTDIYYLQTDSEGEQSLAKLGDELHGPEDVMYISRDAVAFWENLKEDSDVVIAIREFKANQE